MKYLSLLFAVVLAMLLPSRAFAADAPLPSFSNGDTLPPGIIYSQPFTVTGTDAFYFLFTSPTIADAFVLTQTQFNNFQAGVAFTAIGGLRNQSGRATFTLSPGTYVVGIKNTGTTPLDFAYDLVRATSIQTVRAADTHQVPATGRLSQVFTVNPGDKMFFASVAEGLNGFVLTPDEAAKFNAGLPFTPVGGNDALTKLIDGSAHGELDLAAGNYYLAYINNTNILRPATYIVGVARNVPDSNPGPVTPPATVVPYFNAQTDEGVGGTFTDGVYRTLFNNKNATKAPSFLCTGCTAGQFVRIYAAGTLIAQGVAGGNQLTLKANGKIALPDGDYPITASQFNGQTESTKPQYFVMTVDTLVPTPPADLDLAPETDSGPSQDDNITASSILTFSGSSEPLARVLMLADGKAVRTPTVQADQNGHWTMTFDAPKKGKVKFAAAQMDTAGNVSKPTTPPLLVNLLKPPSTPGKPDLIKADKVKSNTPGAIATTNATPTFTGTGTKENTATLFIDGVEVGSSVIDSKGKWSITLTAPLTLGLHEANARQSDLAGGVSALSKTTKIVLQP